MNLVNLDVPNPVIFVCACVHSTAVASWRSVSFACVLCTACGLVHDFMAVSDHQLEIKVYKKLSDNFMMQKYDIPCKNAYFSTWSIISGKGEMAWPIIGGTVWPFISGKRDSMAY